MVCLCRAAFLDWAASAGRHGAGLSAPLFHGGQLQARRRAAIAAYDAAAASYRQTVLAAFGSVADALRALDADARALQAQVDAQSQARVALELAQKQFGAGALSQLQADRYADTVTLFGALGGGWWNRDAAAVANP